MQALGPALPPSLQDQACQLVCIPSRALVQLAGSLGVEVSRSAEDGGMTLSERVGAAAELVRQVIARGAGNSLLQRMLRIASMNPRTVEVP